MNLQHEVHGAHLSWPLWPKGQLHFLLYCCAAESQSKTWSIRHRGEMHTLIGSFKFILHQWQQEGMVCVDQNGAAGCCFHAKLPGLLSRLRWDRCEPVCSFWWCTVTSSMSGNTESLNRVFTSLCVVIRVYFELQQKWQIKDQVQPDPGDWIWTF